MKKNLFAMRMAFPLSANAAGDEPMSNEAQAAEHGGQPMPKQGSEHGGRPMN